VTVVLRLVTPWPVVPDAPRHVDVGGAHDNHFARPQACQPLEFNHRPHLAGDVRADCVHELVRDGLDRLCFASL